MINRFILILLAVCFFIYSTLINGYLLTTSVGLSFSLYIFLSFINKLGHELPIKEFILLIASFQWIVGAKISYNLGKQHYKYFMYVGEEEYMGYVVPSVLLFYLGISLFTKKLRLDGLKETIFNNKEILKRGAISLIFIGFASAIISRFYQGGLSFALFLSELLLYIGLCYLLFIYERHKYLIFVLTLAVIFILSINQGSFHKLLLVGSFLSFFTISPQFKFLQKLLLIVIGVSFVYVIQAVKNDLRDVIWRSKTGQNPVTVFWDLVKKEFVVDESELYYLGESESVKEQAEINVRLNQGWIISKTLENVPKNAPFQNGKTIVESIEASVLPRFLFPDKVGAAQALDNFRMITGLPINNSTSMGLSVTAEFYANFGITGGWIAILIYGIFLGFMIKFFIFNVGRNSPLIFFWFILFFFQVVKAETELMKIINHLVKSLLFFVLLRIVLNFLNIKIFPNRASEINS